MSIYLVRKSKKAQCFLYSDFWNCLHDKGGATPLMWGRGHAFTKLMCEVISLVTQLKPLWTLTAGVLLLARQVGLLHTAVVVGNN